MDQKRLADIFSWSSPVCHKPRHPLWQFVVVATVTLAGMFVLLDLLGSVILMKQYQGYLAVDYTHIIWTARAVLFTLAIAPLFGIRLAKRFGIKTTFFCGLLLFMMGTAMTAVAWGYYDFLLFRVVGALGGGLISGLGLPIINHTIEKVENRRTVVTLYSSISFGLGIAFGLLIGGYYGQMMEWRLFFLTNLAMIPPLMLTTWLFFPESEREKAPPFDIVSLITITLGFLALLTIVTQAKAEWNTLGWNSPFILFFECLAVISFLLFFWNALTHPSPLIDLRVFCDERFTICCIGMLFVGFLVFGVTLASIGMLQTFYGYEWIRLGAFMSVVGFIYFFVGFIPAALIRYVNVRVFIYLGMSMTAVSCLLAQTLTIQSDKYEIGAIIFLRSAGIALTLGPLNVLALSNFDRNLYGKGASIITLIRMLGAVFGSALIQLIATYREQFHALRFGEMVNTESASYRRYFSEAFTSMVAERGQTPVLGKVETRGMIINWIENQANISALLDAEFILGCAIALILFLLIFFYGVHTYFEKRRTRSGLNSF